MNSQKDMSPAYPSYRQKIAHMDVNNDHVAFADRGEMSLPRGSGRDDYEHDENNDDHDEE